MEYKKIAALLGVNENTVGRWAKDGNWETMRNNLSGSKDITLQGLYKQLMLLNQKNEEAMSDDDPNTNPDFDGVSKISKAIAQIERRVGLSDEIVAGLKVIDWAEQNMPQDAPVVSKVFYLYAQEKIKAQA